MTNVLRFLYLAILVSFLINQQLILAQQNWWEEGPLEGNIHNTNLGNVGIGESSPLLPLHIKSPGLQIGNDIGTSMNYYLLSDAPGKTPGLRLYNGNYSSGTHLVTFTSDGNVGIGTMFPTLKLEVNGKIRAKEIRVETGWGDYVFEPSYKLISLKELDEYIRTYKHLPDIPTEQDVKENGVELGDMVSKLLKKTEELTLYIIEQDKKIDELTKKIEEIREK